ncbi:MAG TPA: hypothetical protein VIS06_23240, partial [Mycobacteriales bacterium]
PPWMAAFVVGTTVAVLAGALAWAVGARRVADVVWAVTTLTALVPAALRQRRTGVDAVAVLALVGTLVIGEYLAGALIAAMLATGRALESCAERRARRDLTALLTLAPRRARRRDGETVRDVPLDEVCPGDLLVVGSAEVAPADGVLSEEPALLDESVLSGESELVERAAGGTQWRGERGRGVHPAVYRVSRAEYLRGHRATGEGGRRTTNPRRAAPGRHRRHGHPQRAAGPARRRLGAPVGPRRRTVGDPLRR